MQKYTFSDIFKDIRKYKKELIIANVIAIFAAIASALAPLLIPLLVDEVLLHKPARLVGMIDSVFSGEHEAYFYVIVVLILTLALRAAFFTLGVMQSWYFTVISKNITYKIRKDLLEHISKVRLKEFELFGSGKIASLSVVDVNTIDTFIASSVSKLVISILTVIAVGGVLLWIHWKLALFILFFNPFIVFFTGKMARKVSKLKKRENEIIATFQEALGETLDLFWQVRASNSQTHFFSKLTDLAKEIKERGIAFNYKSLISEKASYMIFLSGFEMFRAAGILMVAYSDLSIGLMLAIFGYLWVIMQPINEIITMQYAYHNANAALKRINAIFDMQSEPSYQHRENPFSDTRTNKIELKNIYFAYKEDKKILEDISLEIPKHSKVAIVGASGSGKTTLAHLIVGFYQPDSGDILYDGISYKDIGLDVIRNHVFLVLQNPMLFNDTIYFNLTFGKNVSDEKIKEALKVAQLEEFVESLEEGLETIVGKNGIKLSGGQRQRISIARMLIADPNVVILDESTSALDVMTEDVLFDAIESFLKERTTIIIAHRLSTIKMADYIYVLEHGHIIQEGSLDSLMANDGHFATTFSKKRED